MRGVTALQGIIKLRYIQFYSKKKKKKFKITLKLIKSEVLQYLETIGIQGITTCLPEEKSGRWVG